MLCENCKKEISSLFPKKFEGLKFCDPECLILYKNKNGFKMSWLERSIVSGLKKQGVKEGFDINSFKYQFMSKMDKYQEVKELVDNNSELQSCRREILLNPEKYKSDYLPGAPYKAIITEETKKFVNEIILRLNK